VLNLAASIPQMKNKLFRLEIRKALQVKEEVWEKMRAHK
jgi:hypothetical protein